MYEYGTGHILCNLGPSLEGEECNREECQFLAKMHESARL